MADRSVHYEAAFEAYLRSRGIPYVAVDEAKKALFANAKLKSFDFVVYSKNGPNLLIDVKGRQMTDAAAKRSFQLLNSTCQKLRTTGSNTWPITSWRNFLSVNRRVISSMVALGKSSSASNE